MDATDEIKVGEDNNSDKGTQNPVAYFSKINLSSHKKITLTDGTENNKEELECFPLLDTPYDVFHAITSHLSPGDLLTLSRSSRRLREILLSKSNRQIWISSIFLAGLPECPDDLIEPKYASLLYDLYCESCEATKESDDTVKARYVIRARFCRNCSEKHIVRGYEYLKDIDNASVCAVANCLVDLNTCMPLPFENKERPWSFGLNWRYFYKPQFDSVYTKYKSVSSHEWRRYALGQRPIMSRKRDHAKLLEKWESDRKNEIEKTLESNRRGIKNILTELEYPWPDMWGYVENEEYKSKWDSFFKQKDSFDPQSPGYEKLKGDIKDLMKIMKTPYKDLIKYEDTF